MGVCLGSILIIFWMGTATICLESTFRESCVFLSDLGKVCLDTFRLGSLG